MALPINPYVAGAALRGEKGFFGRQDLLGWVARELANPTTHSLLLFGQRRIGKTSVLLQLERTLPTDSFLAAYFDLQDQAARPLAQVLADLADTVAERAGLPPPDPDDFDDRGRFFYSTFLPRLYQVLGESRRPVFLLDEFDVLEGEAEALLPETAATRTLFPFLRRVMAEDPRPALVCAVGRRAEELSPAFTATFRTSLVREIWVLDRESATALVRQAEGNGTLRFTESALAHILRLTCGHPYLTQLLCQRVWERAYQSNPVAPPQIDTPQVEAAVPDTLQAGEQALAWLWNGLSPGEKVYVAGLAQAAGEGEAVSEERVIQTLTSHAARLRTREVEQAPRRLVQQRILERDPGGAHRFAVELFRRWVRENRPLDEVKDELDRVEPVAERLYQTGREFFGRRQWEIAVRYFRDALEANPHHFRARLHLGEALLELGRLEEAVMELERAGELDREEAKFALARARAFTGVEAPTLLVDSRRGRVYLGEREIRLSPLEFDVLRYLAQEAGSLVRKETLARAVCVQQGRTSASIEAALYRLRKKLGDDPRHPVYLETRRGAGYVLHHAWYVPG